MKDILMVNHFTQFPSENENGRFHEIAKRLSENKECLVEMVTTSFAHALKKHRKLSTEELESINYKVTLIDEPGYKSNVCIGRFFSHSKMAKNLKKYLVNRKKPDIIYCSVPSIDVAYVVARYAKKNSIKYIVDIQDLWPEAFKMVLNIPIISNVIFSPMTLKVNYVYKNACNIIAVSKTYVDRAIQVRNEKSGTVVYLGTNLTKFDMLKKEEIDIDLLSKIEKKDEIWIVYVGTLGHSYDLKIIMDALSIINNKEIKYMYRFIIMGDGPLKQQFETYSKEKKINTLFTGTLSYQEMVSVLCKCDIAVNPISHGAAQSIINKHADYVSAGLPIVSTQENYEFRELLNSYNFGYNCKNGNIDEVAERLLFLIENDSQREKIGNNARKCAEERFDRKASYQRIIELIKTELR